MDRIVLNIKDHSYGIMYVMTQEYVQILTILKLSYQNGRDLNVIVQIVLYVT